MGYSNFPQGVTSFGVPVLGGGSQVLVGNVFFVSSVNGAAGNPGSKTAPCATISEASLLCTASNGDVLYVMPGHVESFASATAITLSTAGVQIIGLGYGSMRPTFTLTTATTATINVTANNVAFQNCLFVANFLDIAALFTLTTAKNLTLVDCEARDTSSVLNFKAIVSTSTTSNAADGITMIRTKWLGLSATTTTSVIKMNGTNDRMYLEDCYFAHANVDDGGLFMLIATGKVLTNMEVKHCRFNFVGVSSATAGVLVTTNGSTNSGYFWRCDVKHLDATSEIMVTASSGFVFWDLKATAVADKQGYLVPAADA